MHEKNTHKINSAKFLESINSKPITNQYKSGNTSISQTETLAKYLNAWNFIKKRLQRRYFP